MTVTSGPGASAQTEQTSAPTDPDPDPTPDQQPAVATPELFTVSDVTENVYQLGISEDLTTTNYWTHLGPDGTIWNSYVLGDSNPSLYSYSEQRYDWVTPLAADFPTPLQEETVAGQTFRTTEAGNRVEQQQRRHRRGFRLHRAYGRRTGFPATGRP